MASGERTTVQNEQRPLLGDTADDAPSPAQQPRHAKWSRRHLIISSVLILISAMLGASFVSPAMNQLVEGAACQQLHPTVTDWYHDSICKRNDVQDRLALIMGWESTYALIPALATAIPYGVFTDKHGPKAMMFLVSLGGVIVQAGEFITSKPCFLALCDRGKRGKKGLLLRLEEALANANQRLTHVFLTCAVFGWLHLLAT